MKKIRIVCIVVMFLFCFGCKNDAPESCSYRIIKNYTGTYTVQMYHKYGGWHGVGRGNKGTLEEARHLKKLVSHVEPEVIE